MKQKEYANKKAAELSIEPRTARAAICALATDAWAHPEGSGRFDVHSASGNVYEVSLRDPLGCTCPDWDRRGDQQGDAGCYHIRRVRMALGIDPLPDDLRVVADPTLLVNRRKFGADPEPVEPLSIEERAAQAVRAMADGGMVLEGEPLDSDGEDGCPHGHSGCEGPRARDRPILCWSCWDQWASGSGR